MHEYGETPDGQFYIVMEFVDGTDVARMIRASGRLTTEQALLITGQVCDALQYAHAQGIVHRDIKPANVLINTAGRVKVADFGLAKALDPMVTAITNAGMRFGTPDYSAPEMFEIGGRVDLRADIYAVGVMLYQMLTGEMPRGGFELPSKKVGSDPRLDRIALKAMKTDRNERYQSAQELLSALNSIVAMSRATENTPTVPLAQKPGKVGTADIGADAAVGEIPSKQPTRRSLAINVGLGKSSGCAANMAITFTVVVVAGTAALLIHDQSEKRPETTVAQVSASPGKTSEPPPAPVAPAPVSKPENPDNQPPPLAEGMFALKERTRFMHDRGVRVLAAGTQVRLAGQWSNDRVTVVDASGNTGQLDASLLTRDPVVISQIQQLGTAIVQVPGNPKTDEEKAQVSEKIDVMTRQIAMLKERLASEERRAVSITAKPDDPARIESLKKEIVLLEAQKSQLSRSITTEK